MIEQNFVFKFQTIESISKSIYKKWLLAPKSSAISIFSILPADRLQFRIWPSSVLLHLLLLVSFPFSFFPSLLFHESVWKSTCSTEFCLSVACSLADPNDSIRIVSRLHRQRQIKRPRKRQNAVESKISRWIGKWGRFDRQRYHQSGGDSSNL